MCVAAEWDVSERDAERFFARAVPNEDNPNACWGWIGAVNKGTGYAAVRAGGNTRNAHRVSYIIANGPIGTREVVDHLCRNRICTNPLHLEAVPQAVNVQRGKKDVCPQGHPLDGIKGQGKHRARYCRTCHNELQRAGRYWETSRARKKAAA